MWHPCLRLCILPYMHMHMHMLCMCMLYGTYARAVGDPYRTRALAQRAARSCPRRAARVSAQASRHKRLR